MIPALLHLFFSPAFERYTLDARQSIALAIAEAQQDGCRSLTAEYLLLGIALQNADVIRPYVHTADTHVLLTDLRSRRLGAAPVTGELVLTNSAKAVLRAAERLAKTRDSEVGLLHILGGALRAKTPVAKILTSYGVLFEDVRRAL